MPHVNIWVRKDDWELWKNVRNKSQFIADSLNRGVSELRSEPKPEFESKPKFEPRDTRQEVDFSTYIPTHTDRVYYDQKLNELTKEKNVKFCKNDHPIPDGQVKCLGKGCKYA